MTLVQELRLLFSVFSGVMLITGGLLLLLTIFVRQGGKASTIFSIILTGLIGLFLAISLLSDLLQIASNPMVFAPLLLTLAVLGLCIVTIAKLAGALKSAGSASAQAMQQAYYWMMQQQAAGYSPAGYGQNGYNYPPPAQPNLPSENGAQPAPQPPPMPSDREK
jgi:hypothetical protein